MTIKNFRGRGSDDIAHGIDSRAARNTLPPELHANARAKLLLLDAAHALGDLTVWPSLRLEKLRGDRRTQYSLSINRQYRIVFSWHPAGASNVEIVDYH